jgi:glutamine amidotransferase
MIALVDVGWGNLNSVRWALERAGADVTVTRDPAVVERATGIVLPGVGHFGSASARLAAQGLDVALRSAIGRVPFLGICLGMQLLFEESEEGGRGLGVFPGRVRALRNPPGPLPHMGWNTVEVTEAGGLLKTVGPGDAYFCHTYAVDPADPVLVAAWTEYGTRFVSAVQAGLVTGVQFHPEKSGRYGHRLLTAFLEEVARCSPSSPPLTSGTGASSA